MTRLGSWNWAGLKEGAPASNVVCAPDCCGLPSCDHCIEKKKTVIASLHLFVIMQIVIAFMWKEKQRTGLKKDYPIYAKVYVCFQYFSVFREHGHRTN